MNELHKEGDNPAKVVRQYGDVTYDIKRLNEAHWVIKDLGSYLGIRREAEDAITSIAINLVSGKDFSTDPFKELLESVRLCDQMYYSLNSTIRSMPTSVIESVCDDGSLEGLAIAFVKRVMDEENKLYDKIDEVVGTIFELVEKSPRKYKALSSRRAYIECRIKMRSHNFSLAAINTIQLEASVSGTNSPVLQRGLYEMKRLIAEIDSLYLKHRVEVFEELGFLDTFRYLCYR